MMDNTIDASGFPLEAQRREAMAKRRIGLGMTGLADALMMVGLRYGSHEAAERAGEWARQISRAAYTTSAHLAREKGAFPLFDRDAYLAGETIRELDEDARAAIAQHGIRNALLTSIAPTGTILLPSPQGIGAQSAPRQWRPCPVVARRPPEWVFERKTQNGERQMRVLCKSLQVGAEALLFAGRRLPPASRARLANG